MQRLDARWLKRHPLPDPCATQSKEERGRALIVGGSSQVPGAALLAAMAALHAGAGKLQVATARPVAAALALQLPEAMVSPLPAGRAGEISGGSVALGAAAQDADALLVGPGMPPGAATRKLLASLGASRCPVVLDAGAIAEHAALKRTRQRVLTPHAGEMARLTGLGRDAVEEDPLGIARDVASGSGYVVVMKGVPTYLVAADGQCLRHEVVAPGLGTSGSGVVLAGLICGLIARGADPFIAAAWGVWLHGEAGRRLAAKVGPVGFLAREISGEIPALMASAARA